MKGIKINQVNKNIKKYIEENKKNAVKNRYKNLFFENRKGSTQGLTKVEAFCNVRLKISLNDCWYLLRKGPSHGN